MGYKMVLIFCFKIFCSTGTAGRRIFVHYIHMEWGRCVFMLLSVDLWSDYRFSEIWSKNLLLYIVRIYNLRSSYSIDANKFKFLHKGGGKLPESISRSILKYAMSRYEMLFKAENWKIRLAKLHLHSKDRKMQNLTHLCEVQEPAARWPRQRQVCS